VRPDGHQSRPAEDKYDEVILQFGTVSGCGWLLDTSLLFLFNQWLHLPVFQANFLRSVIAAIAVFSASRLLLVFQARTAQYLVRTAL